MHCRLDLRQYKSSLQCSKRSAHIAQPMPRGIVAIWWEVIMYSLLDLIFAAWDAGVAPAVMVLLAVYATIFRG
jgi:hypothetical protein